MIDAKAARALTESSLAPDSSIIQSYMNRIEHRIRELAATGKHELHHPFHGETGFRYPTPAIRNAVRLAIGDAGFTWTHYPAPCNNDPCGTAYDTITW